MAPTKFGDISKAADDLLKNDYCFDRKLKLTTKTAAGVSITTEGVLKGKGCSGKLTSKFKPMDGISVDKACVTTAGRFIAEASLNNALKGAVFTLKCEDGADKPPAGSLEVNYANDSLNLSIGADVVNGPTLSTEASVAYNAFTLGGSLKYSSALDDYAAGISYSTSDMTASVTAAKKLSSVTAAVHHKVNSDLVVAAVVGINAKSITVGAKKNLSGGAAAQGKVDSNGIVSANWIQVLSPGVKLITSAAVDAKNFAGDSHKFGLTLVLNP